MFNYHQQETGQRRQGGQQNAVTEVVGQWKRDPVRNASIVMMRIISTCRNKLCARVIPPGVVEENAWTNDEFFTEFTKKFIELRASGHSKAVAWKTQSRDQLRFFNYARKIMINVAADGTVSSYVRTNEVIPNVQALAETERLRKDWHYVPKSLNEQWKKVVKENGPNFFQQELFNHGTSIGAHLFIAAKILVAQWIGKSRDSCMHETITSTDHNKVLNFQITETVQFSYLWESKVNAIDCIKKVEAKLFLPAILKAGGFANVNSIEDVGKKAEAIATRYVHYEKKGKCPPNAKPNQCGELWAAVMQSYNFDHWKEFIDDPASELLPKEAICAGTLNESKKLLAAAIMLKERDRRRFTCIRLIKKNIPISTTYFRRLVQLRARFFIDTLTCIEDKDAIKAEKQMLLARHKKVLDEHS